MEWSGLKICSPIQIRPFNHTIFYLVSQRSMLISPVARVKKICQPFWLTKYLKFSRVKVRNSGLVAPASTLTALHTWHQQCCGFGSVIFLVLVSRIMDLARLNSDDKFQNVLHFLKEKKFHAYKKKISNKFVTKIKKKCCISTCRL